MVDWNSLPAELSFLSDPAEKYGKHIMHEEILEFLQQLTPETQQELQYAAQTISEQRLEPVLMQWLDDYPPYDQYEESSLVYGLLGIFDELDLEIEPLQGADETKFEFLQQQWKTKPIYGFVSLAEQTRESLTLDQGRKLALLGMKRVVQKKLHNELVVLEFFPTEANLTWIESYICDPITVDWGRLAAISGLTWSRVEQWLDRGRPFNLIAIDALICCYQYDSQHLETYRPKLLKPVSRSTMTARLRTAIEEDPVPRVEKRVHDILANWDKIIG